MASIRYQVGLMGRPWFPTDIIMAEIVARATDLGLRADDIEVLEESALDGRDRKAPFVGVFFGYSGPTDANHPGLGSLQSESLVIVPVVQDLDGYRGKVPPSLADINGLEIGEGDAAQLAPLVSTIFENLHLLRSERRLFISYRRLESRNIAVQMYEALDARGFDVFLDTHSIPPAVDVQSELWHRLADSDVVLLLDTPDFRASRWTVQELARANATNVQILHVLWPGVDADASSAFSDFFQLDATHFRFGSVGDPSIPFSNETVEELCLRVESLRARALAARHRYIVDNFCDLARLYGRSIDLHPERYMSMTTSVGDEVAVVPTIGVPSAAMLEEIERAITSSSSDVIGIKVIYDERGILERWLTHLDWLSSHLPLKAIRLGRVEGEFARGAL